MRVMIPMSKRRMRPARVDAVRLPVNCHTVRKEKGTMAQPRRVQLKENILISMEIMIVLFAWNGFRKLINHDDGCMRIPKTHPKPIVVKIFIARFFKGKSGVVAGCVAHPCDQHLPQGRMNVEEKGPDQECWEVNADFFQP